jgi:hypothetical protein
MANSNGWGDGAANNAIGWGQGANNAIGWGDIHADSWAGATDIVGITTDPDAQAFITAAAITDPTQQAAINTLVVDLKGYSIWTKMKALYPFVGGTATTNKYNLVNPLDTDAAFRLVFTGGWSHASTGATPNGTNGYANTFFNISNFTSTSNMSVGVYLRTNNQLSAYDFGQGYGLFGKEGVLLFTRNASNQLYYSALGLNASTALTNTNSTGLYVVTRQNTTQQNLHIRISSTVNHTQSNTILNSYAAKTILLGAMNNEPSIPTLNPAYYSNREQAFAFMGDYLTQTEINNLSTTVQAFQTALNRNI